MPADTDRSGFEPHVRLGRMVNSVGDPPRMMVLPNKLVRFAWGNVRLGPRCDPSLIAKVSSCMLIVPVEMTTMSKVGMMGVSRAPTRQPPPTKAAVGDDAG